MGQSLACCSDMEQCQPQEIMHPVPTPRLEMTSDSAQPQVPLPSKDGVLLNELQRLFDMYSGKDGKLGAAEIAKIWEKCALNKLGGNLKEEDRRLIKESARSYLQKIDLDHSGRVDRAEFLSFMLGALDRRGPLLHMQELLQKQILAKPQVLKQALDKFTKWDADGDGYVTKEELRVQMDKFVRCVTHDTIDEPLDVDSLFQAVDVDDDGKIDLWEFLAYSMGRRKVPVELLVYDITQGNSELFSGVLLGQKLEAIYHSSVLVHGKEFWFGGNIFMNLPPMTRVFGPTLQTSSKMKLQQSFYKSALGAPMKSVHLGYTLMTLDEIVEYQHRPSMNDKFTPQTYDVLTRNCNHYSNELAQVLCGNHIPDVITSQPLVIMDAPHMKQFRPLLNKWLGGFAEDCGGTAVGKQEVRETAKSPQNCVADVKEDAIAKQMRISLIRGADVIERWTSLVSFNPSVINGGLPSREERFGQVLLTPRSSQNLRYFDPKTCDFVQQEAPSSRHLQAIDPNRPLGFNSFRSVAAPAKETKEERRLPSAPLARFLKGWRQPSQKAGPRSRRSRGS
eukprot:gnl/MRDRNA2_/MRDRNA2_59849_c0_seq1.p1 gnl/MRDRNA2_/MRDRNA2_59849_c0~~gnl/MRDRNA2_/MRDRNA2_59849_c0_seq1.p1  ORF type:complete len:563 (-),score=112.58 gnl/MRDRNA2_/MRDRNA2_59849_c0_seq1:225-1913(-)